MFRSAALVVLLVVPCAVAQEKQFALHPDQWELGQVATFPPQEKYHFEVMDVIGPNEFQVEGISGPIIWIDPFIVRGMSTKGFVTDKIIKLDGYFKVIDTKKHKGKTLFVLEPVKK